MFAVAIVMPLSLPWRDPVMPSACPATQADQRNPLIGTPETGRWFFGAMALSNHPTCTVPCGDSKCIYVMAVDLLLHGAGYIALLCSAVLCCGARAWYVLFSDDDNHDDCLFNGAKTPQWNRANKVW